LGFVVKLLEEENSGPVLVLYNLQTLAAAFAAFAAAFETDLGLF